MCTLPGGGQLSAAAIIGHDGGLWASSANFPSVAVAEVEAMMKGLDDPDTLAMTGILIGGDKARARARRAQLCRASLGSRKAPRLLARAPPADARPARSTSPSAASQAL
jgi:hypothetical protein